MTDKELLNKAIKGFQEANKQIIKAHELIEKYQKLVDAGTERVDELIKMVKNQQAMIETLLSEKSKY